MYKRSEGLASAPPGTTDGESVEEGGEKDPWQAVETCPTAREVSDSPAGTQADSRAEVPDLGIPAGGRRQRRTWVGWVGSSRSGLRSTSTRARKSTSVAPDSGTASTAERPLWIGCRGPSRRPEPS